MKQFRELILRFIQEESLVTSGDRVLVACSGGVDSIALLHFMAINRKRLGIEVAAVHVDHMLRGKQSEEDGTLVKELCEQLKIPFYGGQVPVPELIAKSGGNVQAVCRDERYAFFAEIMHSNDYRILATAHHAEDQLETVLMDITKGRIPVGIPISRILESGLLIRPLLPVVKESLYTYVKENNLQFNEDPSNESDAYMRNRYRRHLVPQIMTENASAPEKVFTMTRHLQEDEAFLQALAKEQIEEHVGYTQDGLPTMSSYTLMGMPTALQRRVITLLLGYLYVDENLFVGYKSSLIEQIMHHLYSSDGNVSIDLPLSYHFLREYDKLTFVKEREKLNLETQKLLLKDVQTDWVNGQWFYWSYLEDVPPCMLVDAKEVMYFNLPNGSLPLSIRGRRDGDRILLSGMDSSKRLSRLFIDEKIRLTERDKLPVVVTNHDEVCAVPGLRYGNCFTKNKVSMSKYIFVVGEKYCKGDHDAQEGH